MAEGDMNGSDGMGHGVWGQQGLDLWLDFAVGWILLWRSCLFELYTGSAVREQ